MATVEQVKGILGTQDSSAFVMSAEALESFLTDALTNEHVSGEMSRVLQSYKATSVENQQLKSQLESLTLENSCLRQDNEAFAVALKRKTLAATSSSILVGQETTTCLNDFLKMRNDQLLRDNARLKLEVSSLSTRIDLLTIKLKTTEAEKRDLEEACSVRRTETKGAVAQSKDGRQKASGSAAWAEKEAARLTQALAAERETVSAYREQNTILKDSRMDLIKHSDTLTAFLHTFRTAVSSLEDAKKNADFTAWFWESHCKALEAALLTYRNVRLTVASELRKANSTDAIPELAQVLEDCADLPHAPEFTLPMHSPVAIPALPVPPPTQVLEQLVTSHQRIIELTEKCSSLEDASHRFLSQGLVRLLTVLHRWQKANKQ